MQHFGLQRPNYEFYQITTEKNGKERKNEPLVLTSGKYKWDLIENRLKEMVNNPEKVFENFPQEKDPKIERLKTNTIEYALEYATGSGWHKGFPWIRDAFNDYCEATKEYMNDYEINGDSIKEQLGQEILIEYDEKINESQKQLLTEAINKLVENKNNHSLKILLYIKGRNLISSFYTNNVLCSKW